MADLRTQLRAYVEATIERVDAADVIAARATAPRPVWKRREWRRPVVIAFGAAAVVLVVVGGIVLLSRWLGQGQPAVTTVATTTTTLPATSTTTTPPTTTTTTTLPPTTTTAPGLDPAAAAWGAFTLILPEEDPALFPGGGFGMDDLAANDSLVVAVGNAMGSPDNYMPDGMIWVSTDGLTWERVWDPDDLAYGGKVVVTVVAGGPGFVAGGFSCDTEERCPPDQYRAALWTSVDGRDWSRVPLDPELFAGPFVITDLLARPSGILAIATDMMGGGGWVLLSSPDGLSWERIWTNDDAGVADALAGGDAGLVAIGNEYLDTGFEIGAVWTSADGTEWTRVPHDPEVFGDGQEAAWNMIDVAAGAGGFVAVGTDGTDAIVWISPDGAAWERIPHDPATFGDTSMNNVIAWGSGYLAAGPCDAVSEEMGGPVPGHPSVSSRPTIWVSPDGRTWQRIGIGDEDAVGEAFGLGRFRGMAIVTGLQGSMMDGGDAIWVNQQPPRPEGE
jgi:hypothetical protein